jgi:uncharacterized protein (TIGR00725 family)
MRKFAVAVIGAGRSARIMDVENAKTLGMLLARRGWVVMSGGRNAGVMQAANAGAKQVEGSCTVGILPGANARACPDVDVVVQTEMHNARNNILVLSSDAVVACGDGGAGTVSEIALALKADKPVILLGTTVETLQFFRKLAGDRVLTADSPEQTVTMLRKIKKNTRLI